MPEKNEKQLESMKSVRWVKMEKNYGGKDLWKKMSFEPGVEELELKTK